MKPFRTSTTARLVLAAMAIMLVGGGGALLVWPQQILLIPFILVVAVGTSLVGLILGTADYPFEVVLLSVLMAVGLFLCVLLFEFVRTRAPEYAWLLVAAGAVPLALLALAPASLRHVKPSPLATRVA